MEFALIYRTKFYDQMLSHDPQVQATTVATRDTTRYNLLGVAGVAIPSDEVNVISWPIRHDRVLYGDLRSALQGPEVEQLTRVRAGQDTSLAAVTAFMTTASACQIAAHLVFPAIAPMTFGLGLVASAIAGIAQNERSAEAQQERRGMLADVGMLGINTASARHRAA